MSNEPNTAEVVISAGVVAASAAVGMVFGFVTDIVTRRKGKPTIAKKVVKIVEHSIQGFALGSLAADAVQKLLKGDSE